MKENKSYHTVKKLKLGQSEVEICIESIPTENQIRKYLINIYDVINKIALNAEKRGVDTSKWFYTNSQVRLLKENLENHFI